MQRKGPLPGKIFARCILRRRFAGLFGYMARTSCQSQLISDAWRADLARNWRFSRPRPLSGCMERKTCHGLPPGNAPRRNLATARPPENALRKYIATAGQAKSASGRSPATVGRSGTHSVDILPSPDIRERTASAYSHCQSSGRATFSTRGSGFRPLAALWGSARNTFCARGGHSAFSGLNCWERFRVCAVSVGNHEPASRSAKLCRIMC